MRVRRIAKAVFTLYKQVNNFWSAEKCIHSLMYSQFWGCVSLLCSYSRSLWQTKDVNGLQGLGFHSQFVSNEFSSRVMTPRINSCWVIGCLSLTISSHFASVPIFDMLVEFNNGPLKSLFSFFSNPCGITYLGTSCKTRFEDSIWGYLPIGKYTYLPNH